jgi:hypothetical protein
MQSLSREPQRTHFPETSLTPIPAGEYVRFQRNCQRRGYAADGSRGLNGSRNPMKAVFRAKHSRLHFFPDSAKNAFVSDKSDCGSRDGVCDFGIVHRPAGVVSAAGFLEILNQVSHPDI